MENPLFVFISSVIANMRAEREAAETAIRAIPLSRPWVFEHSPASALPLVESYLRKVRECDIFVLLLGGTISDPVKKEVETAQTAGKPLLVFLGTSAPADVTTYAQSLAVKYATYLDAADLAAKVAEAVGDELITGYRRYRVPRADLTPIGDFLDGLAQGVVQIGGAVQVGRDQIVQGDVVLRDKIERQINMGDGSYFEGPVTISPMSDEPKELLAAYLEWLTGECHNLPLGLIDIRFVDAAGKQSVTLTDVYVDLDVVAPAEDDKRAGKGKTPSAQEVRTWALQLVRGEGGGGRTSLLDVLSDPKSSHLVLLGEAGSGKTTFVNYLAYLLASGSADTPVALRGLLPVRLTLRDVAARHMPGAAAHGEAQWIWEALRADIAACLGEDVAEELLPYLRKRLLAEGGCFLLDGLDEVPTAGGRRERLLEAVESFMRPFEKTRTRFIVTARPYAYADPRARLPRTRTLALAPFSEKQVGRFIARFYQAVRPAMSWNEETAHGKGEILRTALAERPYLGDLASRPLLLTLMATLNASWGRLPEDRADLYEETVQLLLSRWKSDITTLGIPEERMRPALEALAFAVHERQGSQPERDDAPADISRTELVVAFEPILGVLKTEDLVGFLRQRAGLLIEHDDGVFGFPHRSFQEYLAGCRLANQQDAATRLRKLAQTDVTWWREVCLLAIGKQWRGSHGGAANLVQALIPESPDEEAAITDQHWRLAALAGQALVELRPNERGGQEDFAVLFRRSQRWLTRLVQEGRLTARERADVGDLLGRLDDPRFDVSSLYLPCRYQGQAEATYGFVEIAPGPFIMGSKRGDKDADDEECGNPAQLTIPYHYWIARYPVTVAQYGSFLADHGGDKDAPWWTATGQAWRRGEWDSQVTDDWLKDRLTERSPDLRAMPMWWGEQASYPNRPVMGVSWFEAVAYCRWLDARLRSRVNWIPDSYNVRLPTEAEWEKAARAGDARRFPWGDEPWDENRADIEQNVGHASAVGSFPAGATPNGIHDLSGNVWEWTASLYQPYPYRAEDGRNDPEAAGLRVVRGGSWLYDRGFARCAFRYRSIPGFFNTNFGFRVVVSLSNSGF